MRARRILSSLAAAALVGATGLVGAPTASAAERSPACAFLDGNFIDFAFTAQFIFESGDLAYLGLPQPGETVSIISAGNGPGVSTGAALSVIGTGAVEGAIGERLSITLTAPAPRLAGLAQFDGDITDAQRMDFWFFCDPAGDPATPIPMWNQAFARNGSGATCPAGWEPSWQEWAQAVSGGWVCTRGIRSFG